MSDQLQQNSKSEATPFDTEDVTLVTYLKCEGIEAVDMSESDGECRWRFVNSPAVESLVNKYVSHEAVVEPRDFSKKMSIVRRKMYKFLEDPSY